MDLIKTHVFNYTTFLSGVVLVAVCFYFDNIRRTDPNFKKKLKARRRKLRKQHLPHYEILPKEVDPKFREAIIVNEIQIAEEMMAMNKLDDAVVHFAHAISVCADPGHLLTCLRKTLPARSYDMLIDLLVKIYGDKFSENLVDLETFMC